ncbi:MAG TPA: hypothetical protein VKS81_01770 [Bacteroidota bacterium]|nr:hypothetical protein [Bacteroidota bacterium]
MNIAVYFDFSSLAWGVNYFHFLPYQYLLGYAVLVLLAVLASTGNSLKKYLLPPANFMDDYPTAFLAAVVIVFVGIAYLARIKVPLLGDSFVIVNNYKNTFNGLHKLYTFRELLSTVYFYYILSFFGSMDYPGMKDGFLVGEVVLIIGFILCIYFIIKILFKEKLSRFLAFMYLLSPVYMQLFFGYVEIYSVVLFTLAFFVLCVLMFLEGRVHFLAVLVCGALLFAVHIVAVIIFPALVYLALVEYKRSGLKDLLLSLGLVGICLLLLFQFSGVSLSELILRTSNSHLLALHQAGSHDQAYGLFSMHHFTEIMNIVLLECPFILLVLPISARYLRRSTKPRKMPVIFFMLCSLCLFGFLFLAKFDLGMAKDWDVSAAWFLVVQILILLSIFESAGNKPRVLFLVLAITLLHSASWILLNSSVSPNIERTKSFMDDRIVPVTGIYQHTFHLACYYASIGDSITCLHLWEEFNAKYPDEPLGYSPLIGSMGFVKNNGPKIRELYGKWFMLDTNKSTVGSQYAAFLTFAADKEFRAGRTLDATRDLRHALELDSTKSSYYDNLGMVYLKTDLAEDAIDVFNREILLFPQNGVACTRLADIYLNRDEYQKSADMARKAIGIDSTNSVAVLALGLAYIGMGADQDVETGWSYVEKSAQLGNADAQQYVDQVK